MDCVLLAGVSLLLFYVRDVLLLAAAAPRDRRRFWLAWAGVQALSFLALGLAAESVSRDRAYGMLREPRFWMPAVAIHVALWVAFTWLRRSERLEQRAAWAALLPPPMSLFANGALVWLALTRTGFSEGLTIGAAVGGAWIATVLGAAAWHARRAGDGGRALEFAATANLSAVLLIPIPPTTDSDSGIAAQPIDWAATLLPLGLTASLILLSFVFHRFRSARGAA